MVFVLFLTSLAVIEYLLSRDRTESKQGPEKPVGPRGAELGQAGAGSLLTLADAIERQGRGSAVSTGDIAPADDPKPPHKLTETPR